VGFRELLQLRLVYDANGAFRRQLQVSRARSATPAPPQ
jgi:hypothetical protein